MIFCMKININVFYKLVISFLLVRAKYDLVPSHVKITQVNMQYLCDILRKKSGIKLEITALTGSNTALTIYYKSNVLPPSTVLLFQYGIHTKPFLQLISCLCSISSLLF